PRYVDGALDLVGTHIQDADPVRVRVGHRVPGGDGIRTVEIHRQPRHVRRDDGRDLDGLLRRSVKRRTHAVVRLTDDPHHVFTGFGQYDVVARSLDQCATLPRGFAYFTPVHDSPGVVGGDWLRPANTDDRDDLPIGQHPASRRGLQSRHMRRRCQRIGQRRCLVVLVRDAAVVVNGRNVLAEPQSRFVVFHLFDLKHAELLVNPSRHVVRHEHYVANLNMQCVNAYSKLAESVRSIRAVVQKARHSSRLACACNSKQWNRPAYNLTSPNLVRLVVVNNLRTLEVCLRIDPLNTDLVWDTA